MKRGQNFVHTEAAGGVVLLAATLIALWWANSAYHPMYFRLLETPIGFQFGPLALFKSLEHWVNDGLMVIFFFVVGLQIKKEFLMGELADRKRAALPLVAALGGMVAPALIFAAFNHGTPTANGWGIPMATDIAFAVGVLTLFGRRIPFALTVFLLALAIVDDLGAVLVIALFYTNQISWPALGAAAALLGAIYMLNAGGVRPRIVYVLLAVAVWFAVFKSGVHATVAGVLLGFFTPIRPLVGKDELRSTGFDLLRKGEGEHVAELRALSTEALSPADSWVRLLHPWVSFVILPIFAICNAGVRVDSLNWAEFFAAPVSLGIMGGLILGKPLGIFLFSWISCKLGFAEKSASVTWAHILGVSALGGIGFTMALFIGHLSLTDDGSLAFAKLAILLASAVSALLGAGILVIKRA